MVKKSQTPASTVPRHRGPGQGSWVVFTGRCGYLRWLERWLYGCKSQVLVQRLGAGLVPAVKTPVFIGIGSDCYFDHTIRVLSQNYPHQRDPLTSQGARRRGLWVGLSHHVHLQQGPPLNHSRPTHCRQVQRAVGTKGDQLR